MESYDYIFAGAGCAGLSLLHYLLESELKDSKILLIDPKINEIPDKTWCYWAENPLEIHPTEHIHSWNNLSFISNKSKITTNLGNLNYYHLNSLDFYRSIFKKLENHPQIKLVQDEVIELAEAKDTVIVKTKNQGFLQANQVFDSRLNENDFKSNSSLKQVFSGWRIKTESELFDPESLILMEFPEGNSPEFEFFYILPFSKTEALIEYTLYSKEAVSDKKLKTSLENYLTKNLGHTPFEITFQESGIIPMSTRLKTPKAQKKVLKIGTAAGWTKASTGYTFHTIQSNCKKIVKALEQGDILKLQIKRSARFAFYDNILLNVAHKWPERLQGIFLDLFTSSSADVVLRFLNEETSLTEELKLLGKLRFSIFIKSLMSYETH
ncbi:lycopene cyclase family protein [Algoriphagus boritolerans]|nr:lycopene cyclase family protein [Algoriphagus boritolerans]